MDIEKTQQKLKDAEELLTPFGLDVQRPTDFRLDAAIEPAALPQVAQAIIGARWGYLSTITGLDHPAQTPPPADGSEQPEAKTGEDGTIEILYHFCSGAAILTLRVTVPYSHPVVPTIATLNPAAVLYELEVSEMFGVTIQNIPSDKEHLLLPDDWPQGVYPLRKSFAGLQATAKE